MHFLPAAMILPATEALQKFCHDGRLNKEKETSDNFDLETIFAQVSALESPSSTFPTISWPSLSDTDDCRAELRILETKKRVSRKLKRKSKHRMVRCKSQFHGLSRLHESVSLQSQ